VSEDEQIRSSPGGLLKYRQIIGLISSQPAWQIPEIDLIPYRICSYNCIYCECGETPRKTVGREYFFPEEEVISELRSVHESCLVHMGLRSST
jgi:DNA repair photolyase